MAEMPFLLGVIKHILPFIFGYFAIYVNILFWEVMPITRQHVHSRSSIVHFPHISFTHFHSFIHLLSKLPWTYDQALPWRTSIAPMPVRPHHLWTYVLRTLERTSSKDTDQLQKYIKYILIPLGIAKNTHQLPSYTKKKGLDKEKLRQMILQYLKNAGDEGAKRDSIYEYIKDVGP